MSDLFAEVDIDRDEAVFVARGLRALAAVDGFEASELALIEEFERGLGIEAVDGEDFDVSSSPLRSDAARHVFLRSLMLVALADGRCTPREDEFIAEVAAALGVPDAVCEVLNVEAKQHLLGQLAGVVVFRDQAVAVGQQLGLTTEQIDEALD